jgi:hypothetical protein
MKTHGRRRSRGELRTQWIIQRRLGRGRINAVTFYPYSVTKITAAGDRRPYLPTTVDGVAYRGVLDSLRRFD